MTSFRPTTEEKSITEQIDTTAWYRVADAKVVFVPLGEKPNKDGEMRMTFARTGIRVDMADGSWWFNSFRFKTWSRHYTNLGGTVEQKDSYTETCLKRDWGNRPHLLEALNKGVVIALEAEAEKKAAGRAA